MIEITGVIDSAKRRTSSYGPFFALLIKQSDKLYECIVGEELIDQFEDRFSVGDKIHCWGRERKNGGPISITSLDTSTKAARPRWEKEAALKLALDGAESLGLVPVVSKHNGYYTYRFCRKQFCTKIDGRAVKINGIRVPLWLRNLDLAPDPAF